MAGDHKCPVCQASFTRPQHVARHMRFHKLEFPQLTHSLHSSPVFKLNLSPYHSRYRRSSSIQVLASWRSVRY
ncbi:hypothetical protein BJV78DRAFT_1243055 [Lactifluus subvellereus]|nr:hypothetical protein BJV78DRAFT_1243055 [Lactifluus subvellereus]